MTKDISLGNEKNAGKKLPVLTAAKASVSGPVIQLDPGDFARVLARIDEPIVVKSHTGRISRKYKYMTSYKGFTFCTGSRESLLLPDNVEVIEARKLCSPG